MGTGTIKIDSGTGYLRVATEDYYVSLSIVGQVPEVPLQIPFQLAWELGKLLQEEWGALLTHHADVIMEETGLQHSFGRPVGVTWPFSSVALVLCEDKKSELRLYKPGTDLPKWTIHLRGDIGAIISALGAALHHYCAR